MKQLSVLCLSLALMFSLSGCCHGLLGRGGGYGGGYGAGYPGGGGCSSCGAPTNGAFFGGGGFPATNGGGCGPGGCGVYQQGALYGGPAASAGIQPGPVAFATPMQPIATY